MQQGVGIESSALAGSVSTEWRNQVAVITEAMKEIPYPGKMRQMAIDALMKSVSQTTAPSPASRNLFNQALTLLQNILDDLEGDRQTQQNELQKYPNALKACNNNDDFDVENKRTTKNTKKSDHKTCRENQKTHAGYKHNNCSTLVEELKEYFCGTADGWTHTQCTSGTEHGECTGHKTTFTNLNTNDYADRLDGHVKSKYIDNDDSYTGSTAPTASHIVQLVAGVTEGPGATALAAKNFWEARIKTWDDDSQNCQDAHDDFTPFHNDCDTDQEEFEFAHCNWVQAAVGQCNYLDECFHNKTESAQSTDPKIWELSDFRVRVAALIKRIMCLIRNLLHEPESITDLNLCKFNATEMAKIVEQFNNSVPETVTKRDCWRPSQGAYPGDTAHDGGNTEPLVASDTTTNEDDAFHRAHYYSQIPTLSHNTYDGSNYLSTWSDHSSDECVLPDAWTAP